MPHRDPQVRRAYQKTWEAKRRRAGLCRKARLDGSGWEGTLTQHAVF